MAEDKSEEANFTRMVVGSVAITMVLLLILPMIFVAGKATYYSAYTEGEGGEVSAGFSRADDAEAGVAEADLLGLVQNDQSLDPRVGDQDVRATAEDEVGDGVGVS